MLKAGMDDILGPMRLVGLRNHAATLIKDIGNGIGQVGKRTRRQAANDVRGGPAVDAGLAGLGELARLTAGGSRCVLREYAGTCKRARRGRKQNECCELHLNCAGVCRSSVYT